MSYLVDKSLKPYYEVHEGRKPLESLYYHDVDPLIALCLENRDEVWANILLQVNEKHLEGYRRYGFRVYGRRKSADEWDLEDANICLQQWRICELTEDSKVFKNAERLSSRLMRAIEANNEPVDFVLGKIPRKVANSDDAAPHGMACLAFWKAFDGTGEEKYKEAALRQAKHILANHCANGWIVPSRENASRRGLDYYTLAVCKHALSHSYAKTGDETFKEASDEVAKRVLGLWREKYGGFQEIDLMFLELGRSDDSQLADQLLALQLFFPKFYPYWDW